MRHAQRKWPLRTFLNRLFIYFQCIYIFVHVILCTYFHIIFSHIFPQLYIPIDKAWTHQRSRGPCIYILPCIYIYASNPVYFHIYFCIYIPIHKAWTHHAQRKWSFKTLPPVPAAAQQARPANILLSHGCAYCLCIF